MPDQQRAFREESMALDGLWDFTYTPHGPEQGTPLPPEQAFSSSMPVPGYWDDHAAVLRTAPWWGERRCNDAYQPITCPMGSMPPDASLPYLSGTGWYRRVCLAPSDRKAVLHLGGVMMEVHVWVNGEWAGHHLGHSTPCDIELDKGWRPGEKNEIILAVSNLRKDRLGCILRGWKGRSGGLYGQVRLDFHRSGRLADLYVFASQDLSTLHWRCALAGDAGPPDGELHWTVEDPDSGRVLSSGREAATSRNMAWESSATGLRPWSDRDPHLYRLRMVWHRETGPASTLSQPFGLRRLTPQGTNLHLNGRPVYLRGLTDHAYFALTCTAPRDIAYYRAAIRAYRAIGFNWIRFHTWTPPEPYLQAADELGMLIQVEPPRGFETREWVDILRACRRHPSVVIYCCGNEELLDEQRIAELEDLAGLCREWAPDALFNPQEALRGIEYSWSRTDLGTPGQGREEQPYPHNPVRLERLKSFSDVLGQYAWGQLSYRSIDGKADEIDRRLAVYERPCLSHEVCLHGNYLNLDLEQRYRGTRIGTAMFEAVSAHMREHGLLDRAAVYYRNSCAWMRLARKHALETARRCHGITGYDLLGAIDTHWHRTGYPCGVMNEFFELKPGETPRDVLRYNGESVLLIDLPRERNLSHGQSVDQPLLVSLFAPDDLEQAEIRWSLRGPDGREYAGRRENVRHLTTGSLHDLGRVSFVAPDVDRPMPLTLHAHLVSAALEIDNAWDLWVFPEKTAGTQGVAGDGPFQERFKDRCTAAGAAHTICKAVYDMREEDRRFLAEGGRLLCLGTGGLPSLSTSFQPACVGRANGNLATVINDHWITRRFPNAGFCDWQFFRMLHEGKAIAWKQPLLPYRPIIEIASSFKNILPQAGLVEFQAGKGRLLLCTLHIDPRDPGAACLLDLMLDYLTLPELPAAPAWPENLPLPPWNENTTQHLQATDMGFDARAVLS